MPQNDLTMNHVSQGPAHSSSIARVRSLLAGDRSGKCNVENTSNIKSAPGSVVDMKFLRVTPSGHSEIVDTMLV